MVITTDSEIDRALTRAKEIENEPLVTGVRFHRGLDLFILHLSDGSRRVLARENLEGLQTASKPQLSHVEILGRGTGLHWPDLDVDLYVPNLLRGIFGTQRWMSQIGRQGGKARSTAKSKAARANGIKGGRPKKISPGR